MMREDGVLIVGGGLAAQRCAETLRRKGFEGRVRMVCAEPEPPYDRPPLSKELLAGATEEGSLAYRPARWYEEKGVELLLGRRAEALDPGARAVRLDGGEEIGYGALLIATGGEARRLPFLAGFENVHSLRALADARRLRADLAPGSGLAVIGAGFIGQEVAATARGLGAEVTMIEALTAPLVPVLGAELGAWFAELHRAEGVRVLTGAKLESARGRGGRVEELVLAGGDAVACDAVVVGSAPSRPPAGCAAAASIRGACAPTRRGAPRCPTSTPPATPRSPSIPAAGRTPGPSTGTPPPGRARRRRGRCSARTPAPRRCRASGATSTGSGSSTSATPGGPTRSRSRATPANVTSKPSSPARTSRSPA